MFTWIPLWINKFSWFQTVVVLDRKLIVKRKEFDEYNMCSYWTKPKPEWRVEKIL